MNCCCHVTQSKDERAETDSTGKTERVPPELHHRNASMLTRWIPGGEIYVGESCTSQDSDCR